ncbi:CIC11C00000000030 [Sungouiella intermedia]|uniref:CIC11C00000000030 n=1 Tax=Sungouiella intermedia TaxID=45354 RepID=A0A1L0BBA8_9ASCO|nr:CIC11C00000000030 [[Candida] intermedia]
MSSYYFAIIGTRDNPIYELELSSFKSSAKIVPGESQFSPKIKELLPFITNSSLDLIEDAQWTTGSFHLGKVDAFYGLQVSAFITQGNIKFVLCYDSVGNVDSALSGSKHDDGVIKQFFVETYDYYVKALLNPFYSVNDSLVSPDFDYRIKSLARKYL